jgi:hypothetical protein
MWGMRVRTLFKLVVLGGFIALLMRPRKQRASAPIVRVPPVIDAEEVAEPVAFDSELAPAFEPYRDDDDVAMEDGQNWVEHLEQDAAEDGLLPEHPIDLRDDTRRHDLRDIPVADRGSGGPGGL